MDNSFFLYLEQLELMLFFAGYPLVYLLVKVLGEIAPLKNLFDIKITHLLPYTYALVGLLYFGLQVKSLYPDYSFEHIRLSTQGPFLKIWGLLSISFFMPVLSKKPVFSFLHSLVFFFFLAKDLVNNTFFSVDKTVVNNDMHIYSYSLLINISTFVFILLIYALLKRIKHKKTNSF